MKLIEALSSAKVNVARVRRASWPTLAYVYHPMDGSSEYAQYYDRKSPRVPDYVKTKLLPEADDWEPYDGPLDPADDGYKALEVVVVFNDEGDSEALYLDGEYEYEDDEQSISAAAVAEVANGRYFRLVSMYVKSLRKTGGKWPKRLDVLGATNWPDTEKDDYSGVI